MRERTTFDGQGGRPEAQVFEYQRPVLSRSKAVVTLCRTDLVFGAVQVLRRGGENNLHAHAHQDGFWFVLSGRVRFYTTDDQVVAELGPHEGILIPRLYPYWFESVGDDEAEMVQVEASAKPRRTDEELMADRIDYAPRRGIIAESDSHG